MPHGTKKSSAVRLPQCNLQIRIVTLAVHSACQQIGHEWRIANYNKQSKEKNG